MNIDLIIPRDDAHWHGLRLQDVTSTEMPALFGMSPYQTRYELWHRKKAATVEDFADNERARWGRRLEAAIAAGIAEDHGWTIRPLKVYARDPAHRIGASFDFEILGDPRGPGVLEIKNVDRLQYARHWTDEEAPAHIEVQLQAQLAVLEPLDYRWGVIAALVGGNTPTVIVRDADPEVAMAMRSQAVEFWRTVDADEPPPPAFPEDADMVIRMHGYAEPGTLADLTGNHRAAELAAMYREAAAAETVASDRKKSAKAELLEIIGDREKAVLSGGIKISAGMVAPSQGTLVTPAMVGTYVGGRAGYRNLRITAPKEAK